MNNLKPSAGSRGYLIRITLIAACIMVGGVASAKNQSSSPKTVSVPASTVASSAGDKHFIAARTAFHKGDLQTLNKSVAALEGHVLQPWAQYWRLRLSLDDKARTDEAGIAAFLDAQAGTYLADRLRADWLREMGERGDWQRFNTALPMLVQREVDIECYAFQAANTPERIRPLWLSGQDLPASCGAVVDQLVTAGGLTIEDVWQRLRRRMEAKKLAVVKDAAYLPDSEGFDGRDISAIGQRPEVWLNKSSSATSVAYAVRGAREKTLFALQRVAQSDAAKAAQRLEQIERDNPQFTAEERSYGWGQIALAAALKHQPEALRWFEKANALANSPATDFQLAWNVRAALRQQDWAAVRRAIARMPPELANMPDWVYWKGRALSAMGETAEASKLFQKIAGQANFYGSLANDELGRTITLPPTAPAPTRGELLIASNRPGLQRALALLRLDMRIEGLKEWSWTMRDLSDRELLAAAEFARTEGVLDRAIHSADRTVEQHDYSLRYLAPFREQVEPATKRLALDGAWVYGLMRQESRFVPAAKSSVGAQGLMQVMPSTAKWVAKQIGMHNFQPRHANDLDTNIALGTNYLKIVLDSLDNQPVLASAAYNAGPGRARKWRDQNPMEGAIYAETIPFTETRDYVKKVMSNAMFYSALFNDPPVPLKTRLGVVSGRGQTE